MENRPTAAPRHERPLPRGNHPLQLYSCATPNGQKVTIALEVAGAAYDAHFTDIFEGDQFGAEFTAACPNQKIPLLIDTAGPAAAEGETATTDFPVMESGAILLYIAEKFPESGLLPVGDPAARAVALQWLFWLAGAAPYLGQYGHFKVYAKERVPYAIARYEMEACRLLDVMDRRLSTSTWLGGDAFGVADCAAYPWVMCLDKYYKAAEETRLAERQHVQRWMAACADLPAVKKGMIINVMDKDAEFHEYSTAGKGADAAKA
ncbi:hypothetical protein MMPV_002420 [Pyropia vietnamensis]